MALRCLSCLLAFFMAGNVGAAPEEAMNKAGCFACHIKDKKLVGPSFQEIAARYEGQDVVASLMAKVRGGSSGNFGPIPMPAVRPEVINDRNLKAAIESILGRYVESPPGQAGIGQPVSSRSAEPAAEQFGGIRRFRR